MASILLFLQALPSAMCLVGVAQIAIKEHALTNSNRFPSGASIDQVKKDARKLAKSTGLSLHEALDQAAAEHGAQVPWNRIQECNRLANSPLSTQTSSDKNGWKTKPCPQVYPLNKPVSDVGHAEPASGSQSTMASLYTSAPHTP